MVPGERCGWRAGAGRAGAGDRPSRVPTEPETLLVVSGGRDALPVIAAARRLGLRVLVSDGAPDAPGFRMADAGFVAGVCDVEATVAAARAYVTLNRIDGVIGVGSESAPTVAAVVAALGLPVRPLGDRLATSSRLRAAGIPVPWSAPIDAPSALADVRARATEALALRGIGAGDARAIVRLEDVDSSAAFALVEAAASGGRLMVEAGADGARIHALALVDAGRMMAAFFADRREEVRGASTVARGLDYPSRRVGAECAAILARALEALDVRHGAVEAEIVVTSAGPLIAGVATCLTGVHFIAHQLPLATGLPIIDDVVGLALGRPALVATARPQQTRAVVLRYLYAAPGTVVRVSGLERARVARCELYVEAGDRVAASVVHAPVGFVLADGDTLDDAIQRADDGAAIVRVDVLPSPRIVGARATLH